MPTVGGKKDREAKREELLHWWNLIHLIDSKWSNSDLARLGRFLSVGIKSSCPGENGDSRRTSKTDYWQSESDQEKQCEDASKNNRHDHDG